MITLEQAKSLTIGQTLYHVHNRNANGTPQRWKVNGKIKQWKTSPDRVKVPLKNGLRNCGYLTHENLHLFELTPGAALRSSKYRINQPDYLWYVIRDKRILSGWEYREDAKEVLQEMGDDAVGCNILSYRISVKMGINPELNENWNGIESNHAKQHR